MRIVLDTNILVRANAKAKGPARKLLQVIVNSPEHVLLLSPFLLMELERVLSYDRVRAVVKLNDEEIAEYLSYLRAGGYRRSSFQDRRQASCRRTPTTIRWFILPWLAVPIFCAL
jgi:predicted nucleic acid-binding protein